ncbi:alpha/beta family hydrolase [Gracilibacillus saliphilus]|uniref:alpha/beta family hydrolase n=1 Tax=Gracilibacillus saliphilus TaxID=543890 RepID=UPI0013D111C1|nr:alpha/beta family hydrolase [Gracilibacillus saliphilus]
MKRFLKYSIFIVFSILFIAVVGFYIWTQQTYEATGELYQLVDQIDEEDGWLIFEPTTNYEKGIIIYPGAKVEPEAYSYLAQELSERGYVVGIPTFRLNLAIIDKDVAKELQAKYKQVSDWYIGGHSLGGVAASMYTKENKEIISGLFFLGSYSTKSQDFSGTTLPMLSIYGERDGLTTLDDVEESKEYFSEQAAFFEIEGGNHAQFGIYGPQKGDNDAVIKVKEQQNEIIDGIDSWISSID